MRLIDADALQEHFTDMQNYEECACNFESGNAACTEWYCVEQALENAPTIDVIPVKWIYNKQEELCKEVDNSESMAIREFLKTDIRTVYGFLMEEWQKEQEAR